ncbi:MAG: LysM peptidoglycan-binding domain-containing protein [Gammaproteobacteria bacterium]|nr:LysM peptidoglycan-binding domain-containing protein [Gammaproteobacteria bacterium]MBU2678412.1 LysM peptidoglycan-binding domain-containing protein [Gammaproteobacteria bacterium]NNC57956.1 LysM peptidoglycan-binding domain-containing protein [Woeseiaceae bacterium]NNL52147.1 LysM peptidoglycan-binding domain-containing protein [Woeseiaceae bacterium]
MAAASADETFPEPPELKPDIDFWVSIFTHYSTEEGVLHDNRNLAVVYERLSAPSTLSRRERQRRVEKRRKVVRAVLRTLASGKRENLTDIEARILALWPDGVSNDTLAAAAKRIRYQQGLRERFRAGLMRSGRWRSYVNEQFTALGIPIEIAALPHVESSYNPDARSHVGASGIWQFTRSTGRRFMQVDHVVDERNDPYAATRAAGRLMAYNYSITGNWPMAITAYNHGLAGVRRAMRKYGDTAYVEILRNYNGRAFGFASRNFYVAFLAAKEVDQNVDKYFPGLVFEEPMDYSTAKLPAFASVPGLTRALGTTPAELSRHNPGLQATVWQGSKYVPKGYELRMPVDGLKQPLATLLADLPANSTYDKQLPDMFHKVSRGDTLSQIAESYDTRVSTLVALNGLSSSHRIRIGQNLRLPAAGPAPATIAAVQPAVVEVAAVAQVAEEVDSSEATATPLADDLTASTAAATSSDLLSDPSDYSVAAGGSIEVQPLETLGHYGDWLEIKTQRLRDLNGLAFRTPVEVGQRIKLDLNTVDAKAFEERRIAFHRAQQDSFFRRHVITDIAVHTIRRGESIWVLSLRKYNVPIWLFRQYNPSLDLHAVRPGTKVQFPVLADVDRG